MAHRACRGRGCGEGTFPTAPSGIRTGAASGRRRASQPRRERSRCRWIRLGTACPAGPGRARLVVRRSRTGPPGDGRTGAEVRRGRHGEGEGMSYTDDERIAEPEADLLHDDPRFARALAAGRPRPPRDYRRGRAWPFLLGAAVVVVPGMAPVHGPLLASGVVLAGIALHRIDPGRVRHRRPTAPWTVRPTGPRPCASADRHRSAEARCCRRRLRSAVCAATARCRRGRRGTAGSSSGPRRGAGPATDAHGPPSRPRRRR